MGPIFVSYVEVRAQKEGQKGAQLGLFFFIVGGGAILGKFEPPQYVPRNNTPADSMF